MKNIYIIIAAVVILIAAAGADIVSFKKNGGHSGISIIEDSDVLAQNTARNWVENSASTYTFDGMNLALTESVKGACDTCFILTFSFESAHGGYGNREGFLVTEVITPHTIEIEVKDGAVIRAITDEKYNELTGALAQ